jgi:DnaJ-class molecular chaperone
LQYHPDKNQDGDDTVAVKFKEVSEAYETLGDQDKRMIYDTQGGVMFNSQYDSQMAKAYGMAKNVGNFYKDGDIVRNLDQGSFYPAVRAAKAAWLIEFYAPWCSRTLHERVVAS